MSRPRPLTKGAVIEKMKEGWQLGKSREWMDSRFWLQRELCCGGDTFDVNANSARALLNHKLIKVAPRRKDDAYWLTRYELTNAGREA